ncbi:MAG TPA: (d)CMP kinase [Candidatus Marinimicrobia bacterium]|nr:(d)CMP kinase [Candidatus Neomarinimicrobiota bacterium]
MGYRIAIDGPAGAGKSTTAREVAKRLGFLYVDTGAMYRAVALEVKRKGLNLADRAEIINVARNSKIEFEWNSGSLRVFLNGEDVTDDLRDNEIGQLASAVSVIPEVRDILVDQQREYGERFDVVMEGRDIGTNVFPDADVKIYMDASVEERARRRLGDLRRKGEDIPFEDVVREIEARDKRDSTREYAPLRRADDAIYVDTTGLSFEEQVEKIIEIIKRKIQREV